MTHSIGIDVGGTFTDFVSVDDDGHLAVLKHLTTPSDPSVGVLEGSRRLSEASGRQIRDCSRIIHGTTLVANSIIERRGAKTALLTTAGFRDVIELGREQRYDLYDLALERPAPLIPRAFRFEIGERLLADGSILVELDVAEAENRAKELQALGIESVAICLLHAYRNSDHERLLADVVARIAPEIDVTISSSTAPEWREYERTSTTVANAYVRPLVRRYLARLEEGFEELGASGRLYVVLSQGGMTSAQIASELAIQLVESGPAGGVVAASFFGQQLGLKNLISFDMGGTTTKVSLVENGVPLRVPELEVSRVARFRKGSGIPLQIPALELVEIGAGGGSLGRIDALGLLKVGPQSAGADPGPACYGGGGDQATVTDADLFLGLLDSQYFLGGAMALDLAQAEAALQRLGEPLGLDATQCARGIFDIISDQMALALQTHVVERGEDPRQFALVAFGGAGPVHAYEVARRIGIRHILCPPAAGVASALGFLVTPFSVDLVRTYPGRLGALAWAAVGSRFREMEDEAREMLSRAGARVDELTIERSVDMRYTGQGYTVSVPLPGGVLTDEIEETLRATFDEVYEQRYGSHLETATAEALHWRVSARVETQNMRLSTRHAASNGEPLKGTRNAYFPELAGSVACLVYDRYHLSEGFRISGPALIEERESTIVVGPSGNAEVDVNGNLLITIL